MSHWYQSQEPQHLTPYLSASSNQLHTSRLISRSVFMVAPVPHRAELQGSWSELLWRFWKFHPVGDSLSGTDTAGRCRNNCYPISHSTGPIGPALLGSLVLDTDPFTHGYPPCPSSPRRCHSMVLDSFPIHALLRRRCISVYFIFDPSSMHHRTA